MNSVCEISSGDFFTQKLIVGEVYQHSWEYCKRLCDGKKVLHIGCSDYPFPPEGTLHVELGKICKELHGVDIRGIEEMKKIYDGEYYESLNEIMGDSYDIILVPNVIEHLENPGVMIKELFTMFFDKMFILVPNYFISEQATYIDGVFTEKVHPDHYAWYSPYTLYNLLSGYIKRFGHSCELNFFDNKNMISILIK